jgi:hypothetical protein
MKRQNKGQIRIIEAFLAAIIIFSAFAVSLDLNVRQSANKSEDLASVGLQTLMKLDSEGRLGQYINCGNWTALQDALSVALPAGICYNLTVYDEQMHQINPNAISNGGFNSQQVAFVQYICASPSTAFRCYVIHLNLAVAA